MSLNRKAKAVLCSLVIVPIIAIGVWVASFYSPIAFCIPGFLFGNVHSSDSTALLAGGQFHTRVLGCYPYYWEARRGIFVFVKDAQGPKATVCVYKKGGKSAAHTIVGGHFFGFFLGCSVWRYSVLESPEGHLRLRCKEENMATCEMEIDLESGGLIQQSFTGRE